MKIITLIAVSSICATTLSFAAIDGGDYWDGYQIDIRTYPPTALEHLNATCGRVDVFVRFSPTEEDRPTVVYKLIYLNPSRVGYAETCKITCHTPEKGPWRQSWGHDEKTGRKVEYSETGSRPTPLPPPAPPTLKEAQKLVTASRQQEGPDRLKEGWEKRYSKFLELWIKTAAELGVLTTPPAEDEEPGPC